MKRIISIVLAALLLAMMLVSCGNPKNPGQETEANTNLTPTEQTPATTIPHTESTEHQIVETEPSQSATEPTEETQETTQPSELPTETEPVPAETEPVPTETEPVPTETSEPEAPEQQEDELPMIPVG